MSSISPKRSLRVEKVPTADNLADMFTKVLDSVPFAKLRKLVMNTVLRAATYIVPRARRERAGQASQ